MLCCALSLGLLVTRKRTGAFRSVDGEFWGGTEVSRDLWDIAHMALIGIYVRWVDLCIEDMASLYGSSSATTHVCRRFQHGAR